MKTGKTLGVVPATLLVCTLASCSDGDRRFYSPLLASWSFVDGDCASNGIDTVVVHWDLVTVTFADCGVDPKSNRF